MDIPTSALEFMREPPVQFDELHGLNFDSLESRLRPLLEQRMNF